MASTSTARDSVDWTLTELIRRSAAAELLDETTSRADADCERSWTETFELVVQAAEALRSNEARTAELETQKNYLEGRLAGEINELKTRMKATEGLVERTEAARTAAEDRAQRAEERAAKAEEYLARIGQQIRQVR